MTDDVIKIKFGVKGGASISGESGLLIKKQLDAIANQISLKIHIDRTHFTNQLNSLKSEIEKTVGKLPINIKTNASGSDGSSGNNTKADVGQYNQLKKDLSEIYKLKQKVFSTSLQKKDNESPIIGNRIDVLMKQYKANVASLQKQGVITPEQVNALKEYQNNLRQSTAYVNELKQAQQAVNNTGVAGLEAQWGKLTANATQLLNRNKDLINSNSQARAAEERLRMLIETPLNADSYEEAKAQINQLKSAISATDKQFGELSIKTNTLGNKLKETFKSKLLQTFAYTLIAFVTRAFKQVYDNVVKIDTAMTQLRIVTRATNKELEEYSNNIAKAARKVGSNITDLIESTTTFARLGYSLEEAARFAELTSIYSKVGNVTIDAATTNLTAVVKAFNISSDALESVLDRMIYVGNNFAISSGELGEAMNNSASSLASNGNSLDEAMGILTAANVTLQNISKSSTAVRTIAARISASKTELDELGESGDDLLSVANLDAKMKAFNVSITDANGELRSTYDVLSDLSKVWDDLTSTERASIAGLLAGTRQQNAFYSIMQNWSDAETIVNDSAKASGSLAKAQAEYVDSIEGKLKQLGASWEEFSQNLLESDAIKIIIDILKVLADTLSWIISIGNGFVIKGAALTGILLLLASALTKILPLFTQLTHKIRLLQAISQKGATGVQAFFAIAGKSMKEFFAKNAPLLIINTLLTLFVAFGDKMPPLAMVIAGAIILIGTGVVIAVKMAKKAIWSFMSENPLGWILAAITLIVMGITAIVKAIVGWANASTKAKKEAVEAAKASKEAYEDAAKAVEEVDDKLEEAYKRLKELQELSNKGKLTLVEQEEYERLKATIADLEYQKGLLSDIADMKRETAEKDAAVAINKILNEKLSDAYVQEDNTGWNKAGRIAASIFSLGISDIFGYGISDWSVKTKTAESYVNDILNDWENATQQQRNYVMDFYTQLSEQKDVLTYYRGEQLKDWQKDVNNAYNIYYKFSHKMGLANGNYDSVWKSVVGMQRFDGIGDLLKSWANEAGKVTQKTIGYLYNDNGSFREFVDYLIEIGMFSWDDASKISGLVNQINAMADAAKVLESVNFLDILDAVQEKFDTLSDALESINENGIIAADAIEKLLEGYPTLLKYFELTGQGYQLKSSYKDWSNADILNEFASDYLQKYVDEIKKWDEGTENYLTAVENLNKAKAVMATLLRTQAIKDETTVLENQKDALDEQKDRYEDLIQIRKDLLKTYQDEIDQQKELADKTKKLADVQTKLAMARLDKSASGQARVRELEKELEEAKSDLEDYTLDIAISELEKHLDNSQNEYESFIEKQVNDLEKTIENISKNIKVEVKVPNASGSREYIYVYQYLEENGANGISSLRKNFHDVDYIREYWDKLTEYEKNKIKNIFDSFPTHHTGGFVGDYSSLKSNEEFAKLLRGEFVSTPAQMDRFIKQTLPNIANRNNGGDNIINSPLITVECGKVDKDTMPEFKQTLNDAVELVAKKLDSALSRTGHRRGTNKFST